MKADIYFPFVWWNQWTWGMCFRPKLDHHVQARCEAWIWLENQQWEKTWLGVCLAGSLLHWCFSLICFLFSMWELAEGPILQASWQGFCLVPLWTEDLHLAQFPLANGEKKRCCLWLSALISQVLSDCLNSVLTFPVLDLWNLPIEAIICFGLYSACTGLHQASRESGRAVKTYLHRR